MGPRRRSRRILGEGAKGASGAGRQKGGSQEEKQKYSRRRGLGGLQGQEGRSGDLNKVVSGSGSSEGSILRSLGLSGEGSW